jgi:CheY-like chemotaxis protein
VSPAALLARLVAAGLPLDADAYVAGAATAAIALVLVVLAVMSRRGSREKVLSETRRQGEESVARRLKEFEDMRARLVALERHAEEMRQALAARAAMDAAAPPPASAAPAPAPAAPAAAADGTPRPRALVCVAEAAAARVFESLLKARGFEVERCGDGIDAAALAARRPPVLVVLDLDAAGDEPVVIAKAIRAQLSKGGRLFLLAAEGVDARMVAPGAELLAKPVDFVAVARIIRGGAKQGARR